jgi:transposase IS66 family protein
MTAENRAPVLLARSLSSSSSEHDLAIVPSLTANRHRTLGTWTGRAHDPSRYSDLWPEDRARFRQEKAAALLQEYRAWLDPTTTKVLPKSPMGQAITCTLNPWAALTMYLKDGRLEMTNNAAERAVKPFAIWRGNWLFFQREGGGRTASILMSLLMTAKAAGVQSGASLKDVLPRISEPGTDVNSLTPQT